MTDTDEPFPQADAPPGAPLPPTPPRAMPDLTSLSFHKIALIAGLAVATIMPNMLISNLVEEREQRQSGVRTEFTRNWGPEQTILGPVLVIPYQAGERSRTYVRIAAAKLDLTVELSPQQRRRGLFSATVYDAALAMQGAFTVPTEARLREVVLDKDGRFIWNEAAIAFGAKARLTGLNSSDNIIVEGTPTEWVPCVEALRPDSACRGGADMVLAKAPLVPAAQDGTRVNFRGRVTLRGTGQFGVIHAAKEMAATFRSSWPSPSFAGDVLPLNATVSPDGFEAKWQTTEFGSPRITTSTAVSDQSMWNGPSIGVDLIDAMPIYRMINRVAKYGLLFIILSFATYFFFEVLSRLRIHVVHYGMVALSLSLFSLLLLSLAEPIGYTNGYLVAAGLVLLQSTLYTAAVARRFMPAFLFALMLASLFAFIYVLLGLETYSLLIGALALFAVVSVLMALTQMINLPGRLTSAPA
jgi:inner membrane protein